MKKYSEQIEYQENPFITASDIAELKATRSLKVLKNQSYKKIVDKRTGDEEAVLLAKYETNERNFIKIYTESDELKQQLLKLVSEASKLTIQVLFIMMLYELNYEFDTVYLHIESISEKLNRRLDKKQFINAINELINYNVIAKSTIKHKYFINIGIMFRGLRFHLFAKLLNE